MPNVGRIAGEFSKAFLLKMDSYISVILILIVMGWKERETWPQAVNGEPHLFDFWFQTTRIALLTENRLFESFDDSPF